MLSIYGAGDRAGVALGPASSSLGLVDIASDLGFDRAGILHRRRGRPNAYGGTLASTKTRAVMRLVPGQVAISRAFSA